MNKAKTIGLSFFTNRNENGSFDIPEAYPQPQHAGCILVEVFLYPCVLEKLPPGGGGLPISKRSGVRHLLGL